MKKTICRAAIITLAGIGLTAGLVNAADDTGLYFLDEVRVDGVAWSDATTTITTGQTYAVELDMSYDVVALLPFQEEYMTSQTVNININGVNVWSGTDDTPGNVDTSGNQVNHAEWTLSGDLLYADLIEPEGVYAAYFSRTGADNGDGFSNGSFSFTQDVTMTNPVPEPSTVLLLGAGLAGLIAVRRRKK